MLNPYLMGAKMALKQYPFVKREAEIHGPFCIYANRDVFQDTGIMLRRRQRFRVITEGEISIDYGKTWLDADGFVKMGEGQGTKACYPGARWRQWSLGALLGFVSTFSRPFLIGTFYEGRAKESGHLCFCVNDTLRYYVDNSGYYTVRVVTF